MSFKKYASPSAWLRALLRSTVHAGTSAVIAAFGTNGLEKMTPEAFASWTSGIGMNFQQVVAVFVISAALAALRFINESTGEDTPPSAP